MLDRLSAKVECLVVVESEEEAALLEDLELDEELVERKANHLGTPKQVRKARSSQIGIPELCPFASQKFIDL